ncbi:hypothetical protein BSLG_009380 [Batrachochytrium salamandrivorans]|nr:hypothetical protein BSLG_009380 [Batrachochytrium salamandrivorans]
MIPTTTHGSKSNPRHHPQGSRLLFSIDDEDNGPIDPTASHVSGPRAALPVHAREPSVLGPRPVPLSDDSDEGDTAHTLGSGSGAIPTPSSSSSPIQPLHEPLLLQSFDQANLSSATSFEFSNTIFSIPLSTTLSKTDVELDRTVSLWSGIALIVGVSIGSGIFASPGPAFEYAGSVGGAIVVWIVAGLFAMAGGLCYAELGTMIPSSGGEHPYLMRAYGPIPAFLFSWTGMSITRPGSLSIITVICAEYAGRLITYGTNSTNPAPSLLVKAIAISIVVILTFINIISARASTVLQNALSLLKLGSLVWIGVLGAIHAARDPLSSGNFNKGIISIWLRGELKNPTRNLPRAISFGTLIVLICYVVTNMSYFSVLPSSVIATSTTVGMDFGKQVFGHIGGIIIPLIVIASTFGAANATLYTGSRVAFIAAQTGHAPKFLSRINPHTRTPINALVLQSILSVLFIAVGSFKSLVNFYSMIAWTFYLLAVLGLIIMRFTEPYAERPFSVWLGVPIVFCISTVCLIAFSMWEAPTEAVGAVLFVISGIPVYFVGIKYGVTSEDVGHSCFMWVASLVDTILPFASVQQFLQRRGYQRQGDMDDSQIEMM